MKNIEITLRWHRFGELKPFPKYSMKLTALAFLIIAGLSLLRLEYRIAWF